METGADPCGAARSGHDGSSLGLEVRVWVGYECSILLALRSCWLALACTCCVLRCVTMTMCWHIVHCVCAGRRTIRAVSRGKRPSHIAMGDHCAAPVTNMELVVVQQIPYPCRTKNRITANQGCGLWSAGQSSASSRSSSATGTSKPLARSATPLMSSLFALPSPKSCHHAPSEPRRKDQHPCAGAKRAFCIDLKMNPFASRRKLQLHS